MPASYRTKKGTHTATNMYVHSLSLTDLTRFLQLYPAYQPTKQVIERTAKKSSILTSKSQNLNFTHQPRQIPLSFFINKTDLYFLNSERGDK